MQNAPLPPPTDAPLKESKAYLEFVAWSKENLGPAVAAPIARVSCLQALSMAIETTKEIRSTANKANIKCKPVVMDSLRDAEKAFVDAAKHVDELHVLLKNVLPGKENAELMGAMMAIGNRVRIADEVSKAYTEQAQTAAETDKVKKNMEKAKKSTVGVPKELVGLNAESLEGAKRTDQMLSAQLKNDQKEFSDLQKAFEAEKVAPEMKRNALKAQTGIAKGMRKERDEILQNLIVVREEVRRMEETDKKEEDLDVEQRRSMKKAAPAATLDASQTVSRGPTMEEVASDSSRCTKCRKNETFTMLYPCCHPICEVCFNTAVDKWDVNGKRRFDLASCPVIGCNRRKVTGFMGLVQGFRVDTDSSNVTNVWPIWEKEAESFFNDYAQSAPSTTEGWKTELCKDYTKDECALSREDCPRAHGQRDLRPNN